MAILSPKDSVLRLLDPQATDGTGPGYISALDLKVVCGNLYDMIERVNVDVVGWPSDPRISALTTSVAGSNASLSALRDALLDPVFGGLRSFASQEELVYALASAISLNLLPDRQSLQPSNTAFTDPTVQNVTDMNNKYVGSLPFNWADTDFVTVNGTTYWWNSYRFIVVTGASAGSGLGNPHDVQPGDHLLSPQTLTLTAASLSALGLVANDLSWNAKAAKGNMPFSIQEHSASSGSRARLFRWVPAALATPKGYFEEV